MLTWRTALSGSARVRALIHVLPVRKHRTKEATMMHAQRQRESKPGPEKETIIMMG